MVIEVCGKLFGNQRFHQKKKIFTWKLATNVFPTCNICGMNVESGYHATMSYTKAKTLRQGLSEVWNLPHESDLVYTGKEWVLVLLDKLNQETRDKMMFLWWRA
jgi:hypothetical protein